MPDARKPLNVLYEDWAECTRCELGVRRVAVKGAFVAGEGTPRGVLFVGEGPGREEETNGRPFVGPSGMLLRKVIQKFGLEDYYITNLVSCRSCAAATNPDGTPKFYQRGKGPPIQIFRDEPPLPMQIEACSPRFFEEIYIVDPIVIVGLGGRASEILSGHAITSIMRQRGELMTITIPGASYRPVLTEKRGAWVRKVKGQLVMPTEQNQVEYLMIPTLHPAYVLRKLEERDETTSPLVHFINDVRLAVKIYERYLLEAFGIEPSGFSDTPIEEVTREQTPDPDEVPTE